MNENIILFDKSINTANKQLSCKINGQGHNESGKSKSHGYLTKYSTKFIQSNGNNNTVVQELLSAKQLHLLNKENEIKSLKNKIEILTTENRALRTQNVRQEKELINIDNQDLNITKLIEQHEVEIQIIKEKLRKTRTALIQEQELRKESESESMKLRTSLSKSKEIISEKGLLDKVELKKQLGEALESLATTKNLLEVTQNKLDYIETNYKVEFLNCRKQTKLYSDKSEELEAKIQFLNISLKEKEKLLEIQNIYSNRFNLTKLSRKHEDILCSNCSANAREKNIKSKFTNETKSFSQIDKVDHFKMKGREQYVTSNGKNTTKELINRKILEDIRKIISEEIKLGNFTIIYNPIQSNNDHQSVEMNPFTVEMQVDSPYIDEDSVCNEKCAKSTIEQCVSITANQLESTTVSSVENNDNTIPKSKKATQTKPDIISLARPKLRSKMKSPVLNSNNLLENKIENKLKFMYPNIDSVVSADEWWDDLETISVLNTMCNIKTKSNELLDDKQTKKLAIFPTHLNKQYPSLQIMYKLPKPIVEDLKEKDILKESACGNIIMESKLNRVCIGNLNQRNVTFKLPLNDFKKNEKIHQCSL